MKRKQQADIKYGLFPGRRDAGRHLAAALTSYRERHPVIVALPRGGVPVGFEIARALEAPLEVILVRKLRVPWSPETGFGAVVDGSPPRSIVDKKIVTKLQLSAETINAEVQTQLRNLEKRRQRYQSQKTAVPLDGRTVILVDDGVATGTTAHVAILGLKASGAAGIVLAVPVAAPEALRGLAPEVEAIVCLMAPADFKSVGHYYADFKQVTDEEVIELLQRQ